MKRIYATAILCLGLFLSAPATAQVGVWDPFQLQGAHVQRGKQARVAYSRSNVSYGMPPRNAQCGWDLSRKLGYNRRSLWLAQNWAREFPRTSAHNGAVVVWNRGGGRGHVAKIVSMQGNCRAVVSDNRGTYSRDICRGVMAYVRA